MRVWNAYQQAIFTFVAEGKGHGVVLARAGSGKSTVIETSFAHVPERRSCLALAFNKAISQEMAARAPEHVHVATTHSYGFRALKTAYGYKLAVNADKSQTLMRERLGAKLDVAGADGQKARELARCVCKLSSLAKGALLDWTAEDFTLRVGELADKHEIQYDGPEEHVFSGVEFVLRRSREMVDMIDFDDMVWLPVINQIRVRRYDRVFIDETQDLNAAQIRLAIMACANGGRILAVGDDRQSIYQFRGADEHAVPNIIKVLDAKVLPLSVTYRCDRAIVKEAQAIVKDFEAAPGAAEGKVDSCSYEDMKRLVKPGDFVLSRSNAPLVSTCLEFFAEGRRAHVSGREIGASLVALIKKANATTVQELSAWIERWTANEIARLLAKNPPADTQSVQDRAACIEALLEGATTVPEVIARAEGLFSDADSKDRITLSSTHKAKGLERDRVYLLQWTYRPNRNTEEANLFYVAVTRARHELIYVSEPKREASSAPHEKAL